MDSAAVPQVPSTAVPQAMAQAPQAAPGAISREDLAAMARNPLTRPLALDYLKKQVEDQKPIVGKEGERFYRPDPEHPGQLLDITPAGSGVPKEERERQSIYDDAIKSGFSPQAATFMKFNKGKPPSADMSPKEIDTFNNFNNTARTADIFIKNLEQLKKLSPSAYEGFGAQTTANGLVGTLGSHAPQGALDTNKLAQITQENAALQLRSMFGSRPAVVELQYLQKLETDPFMPRSQREFIYDRLLERFKQFSEEDKAKATAIQEGTYYKKGQGASQQTLPSATTTPATATSTAPAPSGAKPPDRIVNKAKAAIAQGADKNQVRQHMINNGYDPGDIGR
jgi:hypothetical protein